MNTFFLSAFIFLNATISASWFQMYFNVSKIGEHYIEKQMAYIECTTDSFSYPFVRISKPIYYVRDAWVNDSIRLSKEIFETKIIIHSCDNVINTISDDVPNKEYYVESLLYKKQIYENKLVSLNRENNNLMNSPDRYDTSIDYVKTYMLKF